MSEAVRLRARAEGLAAPLPPLLAEAEHLASTVLPGVHGRRRAGMGDEFWQYRPAHAGDEARQIDWRRSARSDAHFVREKEWQAAQSVVIWADDALSMNFTSDRNLPAKRERAALLAMALAVLLVRGGERVGLAGGAIAPAGGEVQLVRLARALAAPAGARDFGVPETAGLVAHSRAVFISDFLGEVALVEERLAEAAERGVTGALLQVLDPQEESFPFDGRTIFESMGRTLSHETLKAADLRDRYLQRLAARKARLADLARRTGWQYHCHHSSEPASTALLWAYGALERRA